MIGGTLKELWLMHKTSSSVQKNKSVLSSSLPLVVTWLWSAGHSADRFATV